MFHLQRALPVASGLALDPMLPQRMQGGLGWAVAVALELSWGNTQPGSGAAWPSWQELGTPPPGPEGFGQPSPSTCLRPGSWGSLFLQPAWGDMGTAKQHPFSDVL